MGQTYKADLEVDNGTDFDKYNLSTSADQVSYTKNGKETNVQTELDALNTGTAGMIDLASICPGVSAGDVKWQSIGKVNILSIEMTLKNDFAYGGTISLVTLQNKPIADVISAGAAGGLPVNIFASSSSGYLYIKNNSGTKIAAGSVVRGQIAYMC